MSETSPRINFDNIQLREKKEFMRKGKWTPEEEQYTQKIIEHFNAGKLKLPESLQGITLRAYVAEKLGCDPMRITKKYTGSACLGKRVYQQDKRGHSREDLEKAQRELDDLERKFKEKLHQSAIDFAMISRGFLESMTANRSFSLPMTYSYPSHPLPMASSVAHPHPHPLKRSRDESESLHPSTAPTAASTRSPRYQTVSVDENEHGRTAARPPVKMMRVEARPSGAMNFQSLYCDVRQDAYDPNAKESDHFHNDNDNDDDNSNDNDNEDNGENDGDNDNSDLTHDNTRQAYLAHGAHALRLNKRNFSAAAPTPAPSPSAAAAAASKATETRAAAKSLLDIFQQLNGAAGPKAESGNKSSPKSSAVASSAAVAAIPSMLEPEAEPELIRKGQRATVSPASVVRPPFEETGPPLAFVPHPSHLQNQHNSAYFSYCNSMAANDYPMHHPEAANHPLFRAGYLPYPGLSPSHAASPSCSMLGGFPAPSDNLAAAAAAAAAATATSAGYQYPPGPAVVSPPMHAVSPAIHFRLQQQQQQQQKQQQSPQHQHPQQHIFQSHHAMRPMSFFGPYSY